MALARASKMARDLIKRAELGARQRLKDHRSPNNALVGEMVDYDKLFKEELEKQIADLLVGLTDGSDDFARLLRDLGNG